MIRIVKTDEGYDITVDVRQSVTGKDKDTVAAIAEGIATKLEVLDATMSAGNFDVVSYDTKGNLTCKNVAPEPEEPDTPE